MLKPKYLVAMKWSLFFFLIFLTACQPSSTSAEENSENWYKVMAGTVGDHPITMHLHHYDSSYSGYYYYESKQQPISFFGTDDTAKNRGITLTANMGAAAYETFFLQWNEQTAFGKWQQEGETKVLPVSLSEQPPPMPFTYLHIGQSLPLRASLAGSPQGSFDAATVWPKNNGSTEEWVKAEMKHFMYDSLLEDDIHALLMRQQQQFFNAYRTANKDATDADINEFPNAYHASQLTNLQVAFVSESLLCLALTNYSYTGGAHGNYGTRYLALNLKQKKVISLRDVLTNEGINELTPLLEKSFRQQYQVPGVDKLTGAGLFENNIAPNDNFYVTEKGIGFCYNPYEIAPYAMGEINFFIPYTLLQAHLQPAFKALLP